MRKEIYGRVYLITNLVNGKQYVGKTTQTIKERFKAHTGRSNSKNFYKMAIAMAIKKYGKESFKIEELAISYTKEQLKFSEGFYINYFNTLSPNGYNITNIINGNDKHSKESKEKIRIAHNKPENLKIASENGKKYRGKSLGGSSKYCGVHLYNNNKYIAYISCNKITFRLGYYNNESDAAKAYDIKSIELFGKEAKLNFPELREDYINKKIIVIPNKSNKTSGIKGVHFCKTKNRWIVKLKGFPYKQFKELSDAKEYVNIYKNNEKNN